MKLDFKVSMFIQEHRHSMSLRELPGEGLHLAVLERVNAHRECCPDAFFLFGALMGLHIYLFVHRDVAHMLSAP